HGLISGRLDRLDKETKRILQEASVIGRSFFYEILIKITDLEDFIDVGLSTLERIDMIRTRAFQPDVEYMFKHPLTQEVVYNGVLKKDRQKIHERIAHVIESVFQERLPEFYETLAFHFTQGRSLIKAVDYLVKSGEKSLGRYAVEESHQYYKEAYELLSSKPNRTKEDDRLLIDLIMKWALVFYYRGDFGGLTELFEENFNLAESLNDKSILGMFYAWFGFTLACRNKNADSYQWLKKALQIGEENNDQIVIGYACAWISWTCADMGLLEEAIIFGKKAQEVYRIRELDQYLYFKSLGGMGYTYWLRGERKKVFEIGKAMVEFGQRYSNIRSIALGHYITALSYFMAGDFSSTIEYSKIAIQITADPYYSKFFILLLGTCLALTNQFQEAEDLLQEVLSFGQKFGCEELETSASAILGLISIVKGRMSQGLKKIEEAIQVCLKNQKRVLHASLEHTVGQVYLQILPGEEKLSLSTLAKNFGFLIKNVPFAGRKAEDNFKKAIDIAKEIGANGTLAQAYLDLGLLNKARGRTDRARGCISKAIQLFEQAEAEVYLKQAKDALASLG
ncbi:MAG: hypothetical protein JSW26_28870, partial [Desulfobacterales bacterium]